MRQDSHSDLERVAAFVRQCQDAAGRAWIASAAGDSAHAEQAARRAQEAAGRALGALRRLGVETAGESSGETHNLWDLAAVERTRGEGKELAAGLRALLPLAERIDAARGRALPQPVAGSAGLDLAEDLVQLLARIELDLHGPAAAVTGGRE